LRFAFDDDQIAVRDTVGALLDKRCSLAALEAVWRDGDASSMRDLWVELASVGVQGLLAPEGAGGSGLDDVSMALVLAEAGRVALPLPIGDSAGVGVPVLHEAGDPGGFVAGLVDGSIVLSVASEQSGRMVAGASLADLFLLEEREGLFLHERAEVNLERLTSVDRTRDLARVVPLGSGLPVEGTVLDRAALAAAAQLIGLGREMVGMTVGYVKDRHQFGVPVGSFQAVKHHLANATLQMEFAAPVVWAAAAEMASPGGSDRADRASLAKAVSLAKAMASDAALLAGRAALQCHGAMGYSDEYRLHMWMKRTWCLAASHGSAAWHRDRIGRELGI
jgi:alkylation response protein AidB-like acyl-CoA dehydrogenase